MEDVKIISFIAISFVIAFFVIGFFSLNSISDKQKAKIARLKERIRELKEWYETQCVKNINQGIEIADLKDELQKAKQGIRIMNYVEGMSDSYLGTIQDLATCKRVLKEKSERLILVEKAFTEASLELNSVKNAIAENDDLWKLYRQTVAENKELKDKLNTRDERINKLESQVKHKKYVPLSEQKEAEWWECVEDKAYSGIFLKGEPYRKSKKENGFWLHDRSTKEYLVNKADFKPVEFPSKSVAQHMPEGFTIG